MATKKAAPQKTVTKKAVKKVSVDNTTDTSESDISVIPNSGGGFIVTEKSADGSYNQYISETDPNAE